MAKKHSPRFLAVVEAARQEIAECEASDVRTMMEDGGPLVVIDVRERRRRLGPQRRGLVAPRAPLRTQQGLRVRASIQGPPELLAERLEPRLHRLHPAPQPQHLPLEGLALVAQRDAAVADPARHELEALLTRDGVRNREL